MKPSEMTPEQLAELEALQAGWAAEQAVRDAAQAARQATRDARLADLPTTVSVADLRDIVQGIVDELKGVS